MVNTAMWWGVALATLDSVVYVSASETESGLNTTRLTDIYGNVITDMIHEEEFDFGNENTVAERKGCRATKKCILFGGYCVKSYSHCEGMVAPRGCTGKKCKCCIPVPCPTTTTDIPTTTDLSTTTAINTTQVPCSFEDFHGRFIRRTISSDSQFGSYEDSMAFCDQCGAKPFIPRTEADYELYKDVRIALGEEGYMWLPANDILEEGTLRWYNGEVASNIELWDWTNGGEVLALNSDLYDWLIYGLNSNIGPVVYLVYKDNFSSVYPPICEQI